jgi:site-specific recombinase XerD
VLDYLQMDRGTADFPDLFLTVLGERRPLSLNNHFGTTFERYFRLAGVEAPSPRPHAIRHAFAARQVQHGTSIKILADLMGHKSINSTFIYTKVDIERLRTLACEWPEEVL